MTIRGSRSVNGSNQPLYVIDGVPINSSSSESTATVLGGNNDGANRDNGDGISNLNPDDIESMNILKGPLLRPCTVVRLPMVWLSLRLRREKKDVQVLRSIRIPLGSGLHTVFLNSRTLMVV